MQGLWLWLESLWPKEWHRMITPVTTECKFPKWLLLRINNRVHGIDQNLSQLSVAAVHTNQLSGILLPTESWQFFITVLLERDWKQHLVCRSPPPRGERAVVLFQHVNTSLPCIYFNDQLSSFIISGGRWTFYEHVNYRGRRVILGSGKYPHHNALGGVSWNDKISSVRYNY